MKAILVIDMPSDCAECRFCGWCGRNLEKYVCCLTGEHGESPHLVGCPLRPLPKKKAINTNDVFANAEAFGWNICLDEIAGETE